MDKEARPDERKFRMRREYLKALSKVVDQFDWFLGTWGEIRGRHPDVAGDFGPETALYYAETGKHVPYGHPHEAIEEMGLKDIGLELVEASDERRGKMAPAAMRKMILDVLHLKE